MGLLDDIFKPDDQPTWAARLLDFLDKRGVPARQWVSDLNDMRALTELTAQQFSVIQQSFYNRLLGFFLEWAKGPYLTAFGRGFFQEERLGLEFTEGFILVENIAGIERDIAPNDMIVGTPGGGRSSKLYRNILGFRVPPVGSSLMVKVRAGESGESYNVANGAITDLKTPMPGVRVSNPAPPLGTWITRAGRAVEADGTVTPPQGYKGRCLVKWATITGAGGTADAYRFFALSKVAGAATSPATRAEPASNYDPDLKGFRPNTVTVWVAGPAGPISAADVALVAANFEKPLVRYPLDVKLFVRSVTAVPVILAGTVYYYLTFDESEVRARVSEAIALYQNDIRLSSKVFGSETNQRIMDAYDEALQQFVPDVPGDTPVGPGKIAVFTEALRYVAVATT